MSFKVNVKSPVSGADLVYRNVKEYTLEHGILCFRDRDGLLRCFAPFNGQVEEEASDPTLVKNPFKGDGVGRLG